MFTFQNRYIRGLKAINLENEGKLRRLEQNKCTLYSRDVRK